MFKIRRFARLGGDGHVMPGESSGMRASGLVVLVRRQTFLSVSTRPYHALAQGYGCPQPRRVVLGLHVLTLTLIETGNCRV